MRIAKFIANAGYCSRRDAEKLIIKKKVYINKKICEVPNINVSGAFMLSKYPSYGLIYSNPPNQPKSE